MKYFAMLLASCVCNNLLLCSQETPPFSRDTVIYDKTLVNQIIKSKGNVCKKTYCIDTLFLQYIRDDNIKCIADPNNDYDKRRVFPMFLCEARLVFSFESLSDNIGCMLLEIGENAPWTCYLFKLQKSEIKGIAVLEIYGHPRNFNKLKQLLKKNKYYYRPQYLELVKEKTSF